MYKSDTMFEHSSYGLLQLSRFTGDTNYFDVEPRLPGGISLKIYNAKVDRHLNRNWIHQDKLLLEARLSAHQFAEAITSLNIGSGIPITLEYVNGMKIDPYQPTPSQRELFDIEIKQHLNDITSTIDTLKQEIMDLKTKSRVSKKDIESIEGKVSRISTEIKSNIPYIEKSFNEVLDKQTIRAKQEFVEWVDSTTRQYGLDHLLKEQQNNLLS